MRHREYKGERITVQEIKGYGESKVWSVNFGLGGNVLSILYDTTNLFHIHPDGVVQIGAGENEHVINGSTFRSVLEVHSEGGAAPAGLSVHNHGDSTALGSELTMFRSRGTHDVPTAVTDGSVIGRLTALPYDGTDHNVGGQISFVIDGTPGTDDSPTAIEFYNAEDGSNVATKHMTLKPSGEIQFFNGGCLAFGGIYGSDTATTIPITGAGKANKVQIVNAFTTNTVNSPTVVPDYTNGHITVGFTGVYEILCVISVESGAGTGFRAGFELFINNGSTIIPAHHSHHNFWGGGGDYADIALMGPPVVLTSGDTVEAWCWNEDNADDIVVDDISISVKLIGSV